MSCTLLDLAPAMLDLSRRLNPECEHVQGDMRTVRLGRVFDCVLVHDAVSYMASRADLQSAIATASRTPLPAVALFQPELVAETSRRAPRRRQRRRGTSPALSGMALCPRSRPPDVRDRHRLPAARRERRRQRPPDRHVIRLFPRAVWLELLAAAG